MGIGDEFVETLGELLKITANEAIVIKSMEEFFTPQPAKLAETEDESDEIALKISELSERLGGPPARIVIHEESVLPDFDTYALGAIMEIISMFHRCRRAVCKTHLFFTASKFLRDHPDVLWHPSWKVKKKEATVLKVIGDYSWDAAEFASEFSKDRPSELGHALKAEEKGAVIEVVRDNFWDEAESAYIKIASFWDRVGQLLAFVFFNIRQYERDVFPEVIERVRKNYIPLHQELAGSQAWKSLYDYKKSKKVDGFEWLQSRRNLLVHSLHLRPMPDPLKEHPIFTSTYNHLEKKVREKLKPGTTQEELYYLHSHLRSAATLFPEVIDLCHLGAAIQLGD